MTTESAYAAPNDHARSESPMTTSTSRRSRRRRYHASVFAIFLVPLVARAALYAAGNAPRHYYDADWSSTRLLPPAAQDKAARVIVFTGTTGAWKGIFSVHSWIVIKPENAQTWTRYDVVGWGRPVRVNNWPPDGRWYGNRPVAIADVSGAGRRRADPQDRGSGRALSLRARRRLPHLAGAEQQQLHRGDPARRAGAGREPAAQCGRARLPRPDSMPA